MAYGLKQISPLDLKPSTAIGVKLPFDAENVFASVYTTKEQLKYNIINFLLTDPGERIFDPTFGSGLRSRLFEQVSEDTLDVISQSIRTQMEAYFPQVEITQLDVFGDPEYQSINIQFSYRLLRSNENDAVILKIENV